MKNFNISLKKEGKVLKVHISGKIDENVDFTLHPLSDANSIELHLGKVVQINSWGVREWIRWLATAGSASISYYDCPQSVIEQINTIRGFLPKNARIMSFYVPYHNENAGTDTNILFIYGQHYNENGLLKLPNVQDQDGSLMKIDVIESKYFKFLSKP